MTTNKIRVSLLAVGAMMMLNSCHIYKSYQTPTSTPITKAYAEARQAEEDPEAFGNLLWEDVFTDARLAELINMALENNTSLTNAKLNVDIAHAQLKGARLSYLPSLTFAPNGSGSSMAGSDLKWSYTLPLTASWEVDLFGKLLNANRSAKAALLQSEAYAQAVRSQLIAGVATCYYSLAACQAQLELSLSTAENWKQSVEVMRSLKEAGRMTEAAVVQSQANYYSILGSITDIRANINKLNNTMSLLLNQMPQDWNIPASTLMLAAPTIKREGIPMRELASRPDVRAAEQALAVAYYATNSARAAFYPTLMVSAQGGFTDLLGSVIKNPGEWFYNLAGSLTAPLFARGQNIARLEAAKAQQKQAMNNFEYAIMNASSEVSNDLMIYNMAVEKYSYILEQVANLEKAVDYNQELLTYGTTTYLEVLTAQQSLLNAQIGQITCQLTAAQATINLYQALGGGR